MTTSDIRMKDGRYEIRFPDIQGVLRIRFEGDSPRAQWRGKKVAMTRTQEGLIVFLPRMNVRITDLEIPNTTVVHYRMKDDLFGC